MEDNLVILIPDVEFAAYLQSDPTAVYARILHDRVPKISPTEMFEITASYEIPNGRSFELIIKDR